MKRKYNILRGRDFQSFSLFSSFGAIPFCFPHKIFAYSVIDERMSERQLPDPLDSQLQSPSSPREDMIACVMALEAALLPCLPARELQAIDRSPNPSHQSEFPCKLINMSLSLSSA